MRRRRRNSSITSRTRSAFFARHDEQRIRGVDHGDPGDVHQRDDAAVAKDDAAVAVDQDRVGRSDPGLFQQEGRRVPRSDVVPARVERDDAHMRARSITA